MRRTGWLLGVVLLVIQAPLGPAPVLAQDTASEEATAGARALFEQGVALTEQADWAGAAERFRQAMALRRSPAIEYNLAVAFAELGRLVEAAAILERVQNDSQATESVRTQSRELLAQVIGRIAGLVVHVEGPGEGAAVTVDDVTSAAGVRLRLDPGLHRIALVRGAAVLAQRDVELAAGTTVVTLSVPMPPAEAESPASTSDSRPSTDRSVDESMVESRPSDSADVERRVPLVPIVLSGAGLVIAGVGLGEFLHGNRQANHYEDQLAEHCPDGAEPGCAAFRDSESDDAQTARTIRTVGVVGMSVGGALLATGVVLWFVRPSESGERVSVSCGPGVSGLQCVGRF